jgi:hypothetical protein
MADRREKMHHRRIYNDSDIEYLIDYACMIFE